MQTPWFQWDDGNVDHLDPHGVSPTEAEEALLDPRVLVTPAPPHQGELRWYALGRTEAGRMLGVVFTRRDGMIRIITAHDATAGETRRYRSRKGTR